MLFPFTRTPQRRWARLDSPGLFQWTAERRRHMRGTSRFLEAARMGTRVSHQRRGRAPYPRRGWRGTGCAGRSSAPPTTQSADPRSAYTPKCSSSTEACSSSSSSRAGCALQPPPWSTSTAALRRLASPWMILSDRHGPKSVRRPRKRRAPEAVNTPARIASTCSPLSSFPSLE